MVMEARGGGVFDDLLNRLNSQVKGKAPSSAGQNTTDHLTMPSGAGEPEPAPATEGSKKGQKRRSGELIDQNQLNCEAQTKPKKRVRIADSVTEEEPKSKKQLKEDAKEAKRRQKAMRKEQKKKEKERRKAKASKNSTSVSHEPTSTMQSGDENIAPLDSGSLQISRPMNPRMAARAKYITSKKMANSQNAVAMAEILGIPTT